MMGVDMSKHNERDIKRVMEFDLKHGDTIESINELEEECQDNNELSEEYIWCKRVMCYCGHNYDHHRWKAYGSTCNTVDECRCKYFGFKPFEHMIKGLMIKEEVIKGE